MADARLPHQVSLGLRGQDIGLDNWEGRMIRTPIALASLVGLAVVALSAGGADAADGPLVPGPCPPAVAQVRQTLPTGATVTCRTHRSDTQQAGGQPVGGAVDVIKADVTFPDGRQA